MERSNKIRLINEFVYGYKTADDIVDAVKEDEKKHALPPLPKTVDLRLKEAEERTPGTIEAFNSGKEGAMDKAFISDLGFCICRVPSPPWRTNTLYDESDEVCKGCKVCAPYDFTDFEE